MLQRKAAGKVSVDKQLVDLATGLWCGLEAPAAMMRHLVCAAACSTTARL